MKFYSQLTKEQKKTLRSLFEDQDNHRKAEIALLEKNIIKPIKDMRELAKQVLKSQVPINHYIKRTEKLRAWWQSFIKNDNK